MSQQYSTVRAVLCLLVPQRNADWVYRDRYLTIPRVLRLSTRNELWLAGERPTRSTQHTMAGTGSTGPQGPSVQRSPDQHKHNDSGELQLPRRLRSGNLGYDKPSMNKDSPFPLFVDFRSSVAILNWAMRSPS